MVNRHICTSFLNQFQILILPFQKERKERKNVFSLWILLMVSLQSFFMKAAGDCVHEPALPPTLVLL
jgi:hypothetical protein